MLASWDGVRIWVVRRWVERDSMERWCSSKAPWRARTPIVIDWLVVIMVVWIVLYNHMMKMVSYIDMSGSDGVMMTKQKEK